MAKLSAGFGFTGTINNLSAYKMRGSDALILRRKGGPSKSQVKNSAKFKVTRRNNVEFGGRSTAAAYIMRGLQPHKSTVPDYNIVGPLQSILKAVQELDKERPHGERNILLSKSPQLLEGFPFNRKLAFESAIRSPLHAQLSKKDLKAALRVPALVPGINFFSGGAHPMFCIAITLAVVPDLFYANRSYKSPSGYSNCHPKTLSTEWFANAEGCPEQTMKLQLSVAPPDDNFSLMLSVWLCYATVTGAGTPQQIKYVGAGKVLAMT